jgi:RNase H-fold protein (predicted Holliday junction resolvase)
VGKNNAPKSEELQRFEALAKKVLRVPKTVIDERLKVEKTVKRVIAEQSKKKK